MPPFTIIGAGLAGCTLAWQFHFRGIPFLLTENAPEASSSLAAAGMLSPVTGKAFNPSWEIDQFHAPALEFFSKVEHELRKKIWYSYPVVRLFYDQKDRSKFDKKLKNNAQLNKWVAKCEEYIPGAISPYGAVTWKAAGRLSVKDFVKESRAFFSEQNQYKINSEKHGQLIHTKGAIGLINKDPLHLPQRCAKGEILTILCPELDQNRILSKGSWIVPTGKSDHTFLAGASYEWEDLNRSPTPEGRQKVEEGIRKLTTLPFEVIDHVAGVRPIVRRSEPVIGRVPNSDDYILNGLGSKGVLYAPRTAQILVEHLLEHREIPPELSLETVK